MVDFGSLTWPEVDALDRSLPVYLPLDYRPANLVHVVLDNGCHDSTGGQPTVSGSVNFCAVAAGCGYPEVVRLNTTSGLASWLSTRDSGLGFAHVPIVRGTGALPRPAVLPRSRRVFPPCLP